MSYVEMSEPVYTEIETAVAVTYKNACIVWVERVENKDLETAYNEYKATFENPNEKRLFHGTDEGAARSIAYFGFSAKANKRSAYGNGTYFSTRAEYSRMYSKTAHDQIAFMLVCDVVCGKVAQGRANTDISAGFDSCTDRLNHPDMYIVNKREAAMPRYLVAFYPNAK